MPLSPTSTIQKNDNSTDRRSALHQWLEKTLGTPVTLTPLMKEASRRTYYRIHLPQGSLIAMDAPPAFENCQPFIHLTRLLNEQKITVPTLHSYNLELGFMILTDFGNDLLLNQLQPSTVEKWYDNAMDLLLKIHLCKNTTLYQPPMFQAQDWREELSLFTDWYIKHHFKHHMSDRDHQIWYQLQEMLLETIASQPQVLLHKDFHSKNLMCLPCGQLGVLDYQDAFIGPITYDIASLLNDCYLDWPETMVHQWALQFKAKLEQTQLIQEISNAVFLEWFDFTSLQRHLKNLGNFIRISEQQHLSQYLSYLPRMNQYICTICQRHEKLHPFLHWLSTITKRKD
ncbi:MAG: hypothetical protein CL816_02225 [Coxiellaceae bacterium]|nr:hypothetical protein [Coxiellaceae bacterium]